MMRLLASGGFWLKRNGEFSWKWFKNGETILEDNLPFSAAVLPAKFSYTPAGELPIGAYGDNLPFSASIPSFEYTPPAPVGLDLNTYGDAAVIWDPADYTAGTVPNTATVPLASSTLIGTATLADTTILGTETRPTLQAASGGGNAFAAEGLTGLTVSDGFTMVAVCNAAETWSPLYFVGMNATDTEYGSGDLVQFGASGGGYSQTRMTTEDSDMDHFYASATKTSAPTGVPSVVVGYISTNSVRVWVNGVEGTPWAADPAPVNPWDNFPLHDIPITDIFVGRRFAAQAVNLGHVAVYRGLPDVSSLNTALLNHYGI